MPWIAGEEPFFLFGPIWRGEVVNGSMSIQWVMGLDHAFSESIMKRSNSGWVANELVDVSY